MDWKDGLTTIIVVGLGYYGLTKVVKGPLYHAESYSAENAESELLKTILADHPNRKVIVWKDTFDYGWNAIPAIIAEGVANMKDEDGDETAWLISITPYDEERKMGGNPNYPQYPSYNKTFIGAKIVIVDELGRSTLDFARDLAKSIESRPNANEGWLGDYKGFWYGFGLTLGNNQWNAESFAADWEVHVDKITHQKQDFKVKGKDYPSQAERKALSLAKKKKSGWKNYPEGAGFAESKYDALYSKRTGWGAESFSADCSLASPCPNCPDDTEHFICSECGGLGDYADDESNFQDYRMSDREGSSVWVQWALDNDIDVVHGDCTPLRDELEREGYTDEESIVPRPLSKYELNKQKRDYEEWKQSLGGEYKPKKGLLNKIKQLFSADTETKCLVCNEIIHQPMDEGEEATIFFNKHYMDLYGEDFIHKKHCWDIYTSLPSWEDRKQDWMEAESHAYSYAYNEGHSDSRKTGEYRPSLGTPKQEGAFKRILKQKGD